MMAACFRSLCYFSRSTVIRRAGISRTIFGFSRKYLVPKAPEGLNPEFKVFYYFPGIRAVYVITSAKYLKVAATCAFSCASYVFYRNELISKELFMTVVCTGVYCVLLVFGAAVLCNNLIGKMYANKAGTEVVIAYITTRGQRINKTFKRDELKLSDHPSFIVRKFVKQITSPEKNVTYNLFDVGVKMHFFTFVKVFPNYGQTE